MSMSNLSKPTASFGGNGFHRLSSHQMSGKTSDSMPNLNRIGIQSYTPEMKRAETYESENIPATLTGRLTCANDESDDGGMDDPDGEFGLNELSHGAH